MYTNYIHPRMLNLRPFFSCVQDQISELPTDLFRSTIVASTQESVPVYRKSSVDCVS